MGLITLLVGILIGCLIFFIIMKKYMVVSYHINGPFEEVCKAVEEVVPQEEGWGFPVKQWDLYHSQLSKGLQYENIKNLVIYFVCKPIMANRVLKEDPKMAGIMPCSWAVYETTNGKVFIAKMNIPLMSKMYFGIIGDTMKEVAKAEESMMSKIQSRFLKK